MFVPPPHLYVKALIPVWMIFGEGLWYVIRFRRGQEDGVPMMGLVFCFFLRGGLVFL